MAVINGTPDSDHIIGTPEDDIIEGLGGDDTLEGRDGNDTLRGGDGGDTLWGEGGDDILEGGNGGDTLHGGIGNDTLAGGPGADTMHGDAGDDILEGGDGNDTMRGGDGSDTLKGGNGTDAVHGGAGNDQLIASGDTGVDKIDYLYGEEDNDTITIIADDIPDGSTIHASGGAGSDTIIVQGEGYTITDNNEGGTDGTMTVTDGNKTFYVDYSSAESKEEVICFAEGTLIDTPAGEVPVEQLRIGDPILTAEGKTVPVRWIGHQTLVKSHLAWRMQPVRIEAGALGGGLPHSDLTVTASHGMVLDGLVINASALVNSDSIRFVPLAELAEQFRVFHVETEEHNVILANGSPSETYIDYVDRQA
ncbi:Hint domain-containing protein, partial [Halomonas caseinilytica]|uniref:Hint domain-containing protein n=1 Tax=Halomonas caseinilytica TaxID=438744 RepID=UPI0008C502DE